VISAPRRGTAAGSYPQDAAAVWIGLIVYVLLAIVKKREGVNVTLSQMLTILSLRAFEKIPINQAFSQMINTVDEHQHHNQLELLDL
jgi:hypothetical protein